MLNSNCNSLLPTCSCATPASVTLKRLDCPSIIVVAAAKAFVIHVVSTRCRYQRAAGCSRCASATIAISSCSGNRMRYRVRQVRNMAPKKVLPVCLSVALSLSFSLLSLSVFLSFCISLFVSLCLPLFWHISEVEPSSLLKFVSCNCLSPSLSPSSTPSSYLFLLRYLPFSVYFTMHLSPF